ncbi:thioredoxin family protein [Solimonas fluminis]|uniref:Thioredoxin family protein n=1 Tax=Solimonas fluminis TaxID=2086571 RepID=A0A2S5TG25_9GAMM|nr:thioredoxin family protein [Solimonas fluminis]PPE73882.1 thioredoxin family protein [Solimonas fluminis]
MRMMKMLILAAALGATAAQAVPKVGEPAPAFSATDSNGKTVQLSDYRGKFVVLEWSNAECPFVKKHYSGNMQSLQKEETAKGVAWLTVISSAPGKQGNVDGAQANRLTKERGAAPTAVLLDPSGKIGHAYDAKTTPHLFVVDPKGTLVYMGGIDSIASADAEDIPAAKPYVKLALAEAMAGKPVTEAVTKPYGCSIKY